MEAVREFFDHDDPVLQINNCLLCPLKRQSHGTKLALDAANRSLYSSHSHVFVCQQGMGEPSGELVSQLGLSAAMLQPAPMWVRPGQLFENCKQVCV